MILSLGWLGVFAPLALGAVGSIIGCSRAGQAAIGAMLETESGYGKYIGESAMPTSRVIYGIVVTLTCGGAYVNALVDQIMARFQITAKNVVLCGFQHGSCVALAASMIQINDPYEFTILFEPYVLESYYLKDELTIPSTTVVCIDNQHIRKRTQNWINIETDKEFQSYGIVTQQITVKEGDYNLDFLMMNEAIKIVKRL